MQVKSNMYKKKESVLCTLALFWKCKYIFESIDNILQKNLPTTQKSDIIS